MNNYIKQLIQQKNRVNLPGFGAFIASSDDKNRILFNQHLNYDDGALSSYISSQENISEDEAKTKISQYVESLKNEIEAGRTAVIEGIGSFRKENGQIIFEKDENVVAEDNAIAEDNSIEVDFENISIVENKNENIEQQPTEQSVEKPKEEPKKMSEEPQKPQTSSVVVNNYSKEEKKYTDDEEKKHTGLIVLLIVLLFLIVAFVCLFIINKDNCVYRFFFHEEEEKIEVVEPKPAPEPKKEVAPDTVVVTPKSNPLEKRYNIIVGSYKDEKQAEKRAESLRSKGFPNAFVIFHSEWYMVVIESHDSLVEAEARQEAIVDNYRIESWITNSGE